MNEYEKDFVDIRVLYGMDGVATRGGGGEGRQNRTRNKAPPPRIERGFKDKNTLFIL